uniref:Complex III subunit 9 n=1 Tax=Kwoniella pini CBS 10737 TaxID=1296096 RepID=A0A1B9I5W1_9TREE|nr:ubiquinol-cytochrome c reductase subunit 9 [Kwoniella pini CBS 10737]OCF50914.1 ubiquinol-cytochrome c reductase subunit 9 [Kwoniella pini CBS 10737]
MSRVHDLIYNTFFKRNSAFVATCFVGAFAFQISFDLGTTAWWDYHNRGRYRYSRTYDRIGELESV